MQVELLTNITISLVLVFLFSQLTKASKGDPNVNSEGELTLRLPAFYRYFGFIILIIASVILIFMFFSDLKNAAPIAYSIIALFTALGEFIYLTGKNYMIILSLDKITGRGLTGKSKTIKYKEIQSISFNSISQYLEVKSETTKISCHVHLIGFPLLVKYLEKETGISSNDMKLPTNLSN